ncbi:MAG: hypothetical protein WEB00_00680 [Dehalococcoidia bacterium]
MPDPRSGAVVIDADDIFVGDDAEPLALEPDVLEPGGKESSRGSPSQAVYERDGEALLWRRDFKDGTLTLRAEGIRPERSGVRARVEVSYNDQRLTYDNLLVDRHEDRRRLARGAAMAGDAIGPWWIPAMTQAIDDFCHGLRAASQVDVAGELTEIEINAGALQRQAGEGEPLDFLPLLGRPGYFVRAGAISSRRIQRREKLSY